MNLETDIIGKYVEKLMRPAGAEQTGGITPELWGTTYHHCAQQAMEKSLAFLRENSL